jgi:hypothetical protein
MCERLEQVDQIILYWMDNFVTCNKEESGTALSMAACFDHMIIKKEM